MEVDEVELVLVTAGSGEPSSSRMLGEKLTEAVVAALADNATGARVTHLELRTLAADLATALTEQRVSPELAAAKAAVLAADGVIAVTPVYNGSYAGLFKLFFDALDPRSLTGRPMLLAATGGSPRHSLVVEHALLPLFYYFKADVSPVSVFAASADWSDSAELDFRVAGAADAFAHRVLHAHPAKQLPTQPLLDYDDLLRG
jgi:FMN reductase